MNNFGMNIKSALWNLLIVISIMPVVLLEGCRKLVEIEPLINQIDAKEIYNSDVTANSVLIGIYTKMTFFSGRESIAGSTGLSSDELVSVNSDPTNTINLLYMNSLTNGGQFRWWGKLYEFIFKANSAIEGLSDSKSLSVSVKKQLLAEAKFIRAYMYFNLVNLYGDVPLLMSTNLQENGVAPRTPKSIVYEQIVKDLKEAQNELNSQYVGGNGTSVIQDRLRPNQAVATALLAKVYLYMKNWDLAENEATKLISKVDTYQLEELTSAFLRDSRETIWSIQSTEIGDNTYDARDYVLARGEGHDVAGPNGNDRSVLLSKQIFNAFEPSDKRKELWVDSVLVDHVTYPYAYKYKVWEINKPRTENYVVFRLGEQYLIRAEARAQLGKITGPNSAAEDLNIIRARAGLKETPASDNESMLAAVLKERKVELFTEGHRWFDLQRMGKINEVMVKVVLIKGAGVSWMPYKSLFPIPFEDLQRNSGMKGHQNPGYPESL